MDAHEFLERGVALLCPQLKLVTGALPLIDVRPFHGDSPFGTPFRMFPDVRRKVWYIRYYPQILSSMLAEPAMACYLRHSFIHEIFHLINCYAWMDAAHQDWELLDFSEQLVPLDPRNTWNKYTAWGEGSCELAAYDIIDRADSEFMSHLFEHGITPQASRDYYIRRLGYSLAVLTRARRSDSADYRTLNLPVIFTNEIGTEIDEMAIQYLYWPINGYRDELPYSLGLARCAAYASSAGAGILELLNNPLTNRRLKQLSEYNAN